MYVRRGLVRTVVTLVIATALSCCAHDPVRAQTPPVANTQPVGRLIVKLRQPAEEAAFINMIGKKLPAPERVSVLRAISSDMYVLGVLAPATKDDLPRVIEQLIATGLFEYVEEDRMMTIRKP